VSVIDRAINTFGTSSNIEFLFNESNKNYIYSLSSDKLNLKTKYEYNSEIVKILNFQVLSYNFTKSNNDVKMNNEENNKKFDCEDNYPENQILVNILNEKFMFNDRSNIRSIDNSEDKKFKHVELSNEKSNYIKALLFYLRNQAKANNSDKCLNYVLLLSTEELNTLMTEISNIEYIKNNYLYNFRELSLSLMTISKSKEIKFEFINLY
jgi:hypothetical protein